MLRTLALALVACSTSPALAQSALLPPPSAPLAVANPNYVAFEVSTVVNRPARQVWQRIGKYCDIGEWLRAPCRITAGNDWALGSVRVVRDSYVEMLVAKTDLSYTYAQPVRTGVIYNVYHGTLEARPIGRDRTRLITSFFYDNSMLADDAQRAAEIENRRQRFTTALANMKLLAEGGQLPPAP